MITRLLTHRAQGTQPYENLALEEYLLKNVREDEAILYLWQNRHTVVIGRNQNAWSECHVEALERDGGFLARRLSGGGAVFHDLGNLNFTFLVPRQEYNLEKQLAVILTALRSLGIHAEKSGRNDITVEGKKCSGNAFYHANGRSYHHGTLLLAVDLENLSRYLNVDAAKLQSKGVASVRARVANLVEFAPGLTPQRVCAALEAAFGQVYGGVPQPFPQARLDRAKTAALTAQYASWDWRLGRAIPFTNTLEQRFAWGNIQLGLCVNEGRVTQAAAFSDAMLPEFIAKLPAALQGSVYSGAALAPRVRALAAAEEGEAELAADIAALLETI